MFLGVFNCFLSHAETDERVLLTIGGKPVQMDEFNFCYSRFNARKRIPASRFFSHFLSCKLKAFDARRQGWDTLPDIRLQCDLIKGKVLRRYLIDPEKADAFYLSCYRKGFARMGADVWVRMEHISVFLPQHASASLERNARGRIDSVYRCLRNGMDFDDLYNKCQGDDDGLYLKDMWIPLSVMVKEFADKLRLLDVGGVSAPFYSPLGIHIVRLVDRKQGVSYEEALPRIRDVEEGRENCLEFVDGKRFQDWKEGRETEIAVRMGLAEDGLLAAYWDESYGNGNEKVSPDELARHFKENKEKYDWDLPHFKGGVVHCLNKKAASRLKKGLKRIPCSLWKETVGRLSAEDKGLCAEVETGIFRIGSNEYVDKLAFKCGSFEPMPRLPYTFVIGKRLKRGPEDYTDVLKKVEEDCIKERERERMNELMDKYSVEINQEVLKTVNSDGGE